MITQMMESGLTKREAQVYEALLSLGPSHAGPLIKKTGIPSSKMYEVIDRLMDRGLVSFTIQGRVKRFAAADPKSLLNLFDERRKKIKEAVDALSRYSPGDRRHVEIYEGQKAIFGLFTDLIADARRGEVYLVFSINDENKNHSAELFLKNLAVRRKDKGLDTRLLRNIRFRKHEPHTKLKMRFSSLDLPQGITVFRDTVVFLTWEGEPSAIRITSKPFSDQWRAFFLQVWKTSKD